MAKTTRNVAMAMVMAGASLVAPHASTAADNTDSKLDAHVRTSNPALGALIQQATERSATFRSMLETINASDSFVYVTEGKCGRGARACFVNVTTAGHSRMMWVKVDTAKADSEEDLMGSIGHEMRHTLEAIGEPSVRSTADQYFLYQRIGFHATGGGLETLAAVDAGNAVRAEVHRFARQAKSE